MSERKLLKVDASVGVNQIKKLHAMKENRDNVKVEDCLEAVRKGARGENLMPLILRCGSPLCNRRRDLRRSSREVFGEYKENVVL